MPEARFQDLSHDDRRDALAVAERNRSHNAHLLEKDVWVVATLGILFEALFAWHLTFHGGTSPSKVRRAIRRFSEDIDLNYDIRAFAPDLVSGSGDEASGTIYVLRSKSDLPIVMERRIANAKIDATFLLANVEVVATKELCNIKRKKLESLIHRIFDLTRFAIEIKDRFGNPVVLRAWLLVPFAVANEAVQRIKDGSIKSYVYDPQQTRLVERKAK